MSSTDKRRAVSEMIRHVEAGHAYTIESKGEPVAIVVPWEDWAELKQAMKEYAPGRTTP